MTNRTFRQAAALVDAAINKSGIPVSAVDRNQRILAAAEQLRIGKNPDGAAVLKILQFNVTAESDKGTSPE